MGRYCVSKRSLATGKRVLSARTLSGTKPACAISLDDKNIIQKILNEFIIPFRSDEFNKINSMNTLNIYIKKYLKTKNTNIVHNLILESISAAMFSKYMKLKIYIAKKNENDYKTKIQKLEEEISIYEALHKERADGNNVGISMHATGRVEHLCLLPYIAQWNVRLAWHYYLFGVDESRGIDLDNYKYIDDYVNTLGESIAREKLLKLL
jgi:hypothetical protein